MTFINLKYEEEDNVRKFYVLWDVDPEGIVMNRLHRKAWKKGRPIWKNWALWCIWKFSDAISTIKDMEPDADVVTDGLSISHNVVQDSESDIIEWFMYCISVTIQADFYIQFHHYPDKCPHSGVCVKSTKEWKTSPLSLFQITNHVYDCKYNLLLIPFQTIFTAKGLPNIPASLFSRIILLFSVK